jgi:ABC-2 type transport system permease protein
MLVLFKHEIYSIVSNKRYMLSLTLQLLLLFAILPVFSTFLSTGKISITTPALNEFVPLGVVDNSQDSQYLRTALEKNSKIEILLLDGYDTSILETGKAAAILVIPSEYDESLNRVLEVELISDASNVKYGAVYDAVYPSISEASQRLTQDRKVAFGVSIDEPIKVDKHLLRPIVVEDGGTKFSSFFLGYLVPLMLFFPIFMVGSIILDSVVGEREKKTVEALLAAPIKRSQIVYSKFLSASTFVLVQLVIWLMVFRWYGVPVQNNISILVIVMIIDSAIISTALLLAFYSRTVKEANILLMLLYTTVFVALIVSLSIRYFDRGLLATPFTIVSSLVVGEKTGLIFWPVALLFYTSLAIAVNVGFVERDDIVFGPRPGLSTLLEDLSLWLFSFGRPGYLYLTFVFGIFAIIYSTIVEVSLGIFVIFTVGVTNLLVPLFALIEELVKPAGVYFLATRRGLSHKEGIMLGALSGVMFFALESAVFAFATYYLFPSKLLEILRLRIATTMIIHAVSSGIVGYGIAQRKNFMPALLLATLIHSIFNLIVTGGVL